MRVVVIFGTIGLLSACSEMGFRAPIQDTGGDTEPEGEAIMRVEPPALSFGMAAPGDTVERSFYIYNDGDAPLSVVDVSIPSQGSSFTRIAVDGPVVLPGQFSEWRGIYRPSEGAPAEETAYLDIKSDAANQPTARVTLYGGELSAKYELTPMDHDFGELGLGAVEAQTFELTNAGNVTGWLGNAAFETDSSEFAVTDWGGLETLGPLEPGESKTFSIQYSPEDAVEDVGRFEIQTGQPEEPGVVATVSGTGVDDGLTTVRVLLTADSEWEGWLDGEPFTAANQADWRFGDDVVLRMEPGEHTLAIYAKDTNAVAAGFISAIYVDGTLVDVTGDGSWRITDSEPATDWTAVSFDDSSWGTPVACADTGTWGTYPQSFYDQGAAWVWVTADCLTLGEGWLRYSLSL